MDLHRLRASGIDVTDAAVFLSAYRRDLWPKDSLRLIQEGVRPEAPLAVAMPTQLDHVALLLEWARREGVVVVPYGAGSGVCGGARGRAGSLVIDTKRLNRILSVDLDDRSVTVQAGILGQHLEDQLASIGWMTAHSPSSIACSTAGGYLAARSAGQFSSRYGVFDDMTLAAVTETPAGRLHSGDWTRRGEEDWLPVFTGSEGGLGVATQLKLRIHPLPQLRWLRGYAFANVEQAWAAMQGMMQANLWPSVLRLYDPVDTLIGGRTRAEDAKPGNGLFGWMRSAANRNPTLRRHLTSVPLALPGLVNSLGRGLSKEVLLIVGFEGPLPVVETSVEAAQSFLREGRDLGAEPGEQWFTHRHDVSYKLAPVFISGAFADTMEVAATWDRLPELYRLVRRALGRHTAVMAHFSHAYMEGCSVYFSFAGRGSMQTYEAAWSAALDAARASGGTITHHHGVGALKAEAAAIEAGSALRVWEEAKATWDPTGIMNPGRPFPERMKPAMEHHYPSPSEGPVFEVRPEVGLARVDPLAAPEDIQHQLSAEGLTLRVPPDRPLLSWLTSLRPSQLRCWQTPLFGLQARFDDGVQARISPSPRSAAGPDFRWALLRRATVEWVEVPVRPKGTEIAVYPPHTELDEDDIRPLQSEADLWLLSSQQAPLANQVLMRADDEAAATLPPEFIP